MACQSSGASRLAGTPLPERVPGSDLVLSLPEAAERGRAGGVPPGGGGNPGVAAAAARRLESRCPGLPERGRPIALPSDSRTIQRSSTGSGGRFSSPPALVLVGLGFPKQERLIRSLRSDCLGTWFAGVGISFSFLAQELQRAPARSAAGPGVVAPAPARTAPAVQTLRHPGVPVRPQAVWLGVHESAQTRALRAGRARGSRPHMFFLGSAIASGGPCATRHRSQRLHRLSARPRARAGRPRDRRTRLRPVRRLYLRREVPEVQPLQADVRDIESEDLAGFDAVIHLAAVCNDPVGDLNPQATYESIISPRCAWPRRRGRPGCPASRSPPRAASTARPVTRCWTRGPGSRR